MPRPRKCRRVCALPAHDCFAPPGARETGEPVILSVDEYEAIRLIDKEDMSQEQCGEYMQIARTTVQQIYSSARRKIAEALTEGRALHIKGGDYRLCEEGDMRCARHGCRRRHHGHAPRKEGE